MIQKVTKVFSAYRFLVILIIFHYSVCLLNIQRKKQRGKSYLKVVLLMQNLDPEHGKKSLLNIGRQGYLSSTMIE